MRRKKDFKKYINSLSEHDVRKILTAILDWQVNELGVDGDVRFDEGDPAEGASPCLYWAASGDDLLDTRQ